MTFQKLSIKECCTIVSGSTPRTDTPEYWNGEIQWATPKDLSDRNCQYIAETNSQITQEGFDSCSTSLLPPYSVLFSSRAPIGLVAVNTVPMCTNQGFKSLIPDSNKVYYKYLYYWLLNNKEYLQSLGNGATFKELSKSSLERVDIHLPSVAEQKRIAAILDKAEEIKRKREESLKLADEFLKSVFVDMFGDPVTNPKGWTLNTAIDYAECIVPGRDKPKSFSGGIPWVTTNDLKHLGYTSESNMGLADHEIQEVRARIIPENSVIITCVGDLGIATISKAKMVINQQLHAFQCHEKMNNIFFMYAISFQKSFMYSRATKTTVPYMNKSVCNSIPMICPPLHLQQKFANIFEKARLQKEAMMQSSTHASNNFNSLSQDAFRGKL